MPDSHPSDEEEEEDLSFWHLESPTRRSQPESTRAPPSPSLSGIGSRKGYLQNEIPGHVGAWLLCVLFVLCSLDFLFRLIRNIVLFFFSLLVLFCLSKMSGCCSFQRTSRLHCRKENVKHHRIMNITNVKHRVQ